MDHQQADFAVGFVCVVSAGGSLTYKVQHTFDDVQDSTVTPVWIDHPIVAGQTSTQNGNYAFPVKAIRLNVTVYASGSVYLRVLQGGKSS